MVCFPYSHLFFLLLCRIDQFESVLYRLAIAKTNIILNFNVKLCLTYEYFSLSLLLCPASLHYFVRFVVGHFSTSIECKEPIEVVSYKIGVCKVSAKGKDCTTVFTKLGYNGKTSVVLCKPLTGRMHQIRVHLQFLGKYWKFFRMQKRKGVCQSRADIFREIITLIVTVLLC